MLVNILTIRVIDLRKHAVTMKLLLGYLLVFYEVLHCLVESTLTGTFYFLFHVIPFIKCAVGREMLEKVRYTSMSAIWKVKIDSALKVYTREQTVPISSVNSS